MKTLITMLIVALSAAGCASIKPHPASDQMMQVTGKKVTAWAIVPRGHDAQLDIYVDDQRIPAATLFLVP